MDGVDELDCGGVIVVVVDDEEVDVVELAVFEIETDVVVVVVVFFPVNESTIFEVSLKSLLLLPPATVVMRALALPTLSGHSSTYVVSAASPSSSEAPGLHVGNSSETPPPCWFESTWIVTVTISLSMISVSLRTEAEAEEKGGTEANTSAVPAAVMPCIVEVDDVRVELA